jgi:hypothetical protein
MNAPNTPYFWKVVAIGTVAVALALASVVVSQPPSDAGHAMAQHDEVSHFISSAGAVGDADPSVPSAFETLKQSSGLPTALNVETF